MFDYNTFLLVNNLDMAQWTHATPVAMAKDAQRVSFAFVEHPVVEIQQPISLKNELFEWVLFILYILGCPLGSY